MKSLQLHITGMTCGHCSNFVKETITDVEGVSSATVDHVSGNASVEFDESKTDESKIREAVNATVVYQVA